MASKERAEGERESQQKASQPSKGDEQRTDLVGVEGEVVGDGVL